MNPDVELVEMVEMTPEWEPDEEVNGNQAYGLEDFLAIDRPPINYLIGPGVLPEQGKLTNSAKAKGYKTTLEIEQGLCIAAGNCEYLNFEFGDPHPVLFVQPELSDTLVAERMSWILRTAPDWLDVAQARENFHILETAKGRPALWHEHPRALISRNEVARAIERTKAKAVLFDSLYMTFAGMDENAADAMTLALDYLGGLTVEHGVAVVVTHHFNKAGTAARGSSVYQGWGETDLTISPVDCDEPVVRVDALMRCAFPKGFPAYWRTPNEETAWFECMPEDWQPERKTGRPRKASPALVGVVLQANGSPMRWGALHRALMDAGSLSKSAADRLISDAKSEGIVNAACGVYSLPGQVSDAK